MCVCLWTMCVCVREYLYVLAPLLNTCVVHNALFSHSVLEPRAPVQKNPLFSRYELQRVFAAVKENGGSLGREEFAMVYVTYAQLHDHNMALRVFDLLDANHDNEVSFEGLSTVCACVCVCVCVCVQFEYFTNQVLTHTYALSVGCVQSLCRFWR